MRYPIQQIFIVYMRLFYSLLLLFFISVFCVSCNKEYTLPAGLQTHDFVWKGLNAYYLHQDQVNDLSDRRFNSDIQLENFLNGFSAPEDLFNHLTIANDTKSRIVNDFTTIETPIPLRQSLTNGMEFGIIQEPGSNTNVLGYVILILPNSNAASQNITRGEFFSTVDGVQLTQDNFQSLLLTGANDFQLGMADFNGTTVTSNGRVVNLSKQNYVHPPILRENVISNGAVNIGHLVFHNDFSTNYLANLNTSFLNLRNQNVTELILDLRYCIGSGSFSDNIAAIASMITGQFSNQVLIKEQWNTKAQNWFASNQPEALNTLFPTSLANNQMIRGLNLTRVYILLNGNGFRGSSAIELLINSLQSYINVQVVGNPTIGNNAGAITLYDSPDYDIQGRNPNHMYAIQPEVLTFYNNNDTTYNTGFTPNISYCPNEDALNLGSLGTPTDPMFARAFNAIVIGNPGPDPTCNFFNLNYLYNSINAQRQLDTGVFIQQNLPNLGR